MLHWLVPYAVYSLMTPSVIILLVLEQSLIGSSIPKQNTLENKIQSSHRLYKKNTIGKNHCIIPAVSRDRTAAVHFDQETLKFSLQEMRICKCTMAYVPNLKSVTPAILY